MALTSLTARAPGTRSALVFLLRGQFRTERKIEELDLSSSVSKTPGGLSLTPRLGSQKKILPGINHFEIFTEQYRHVCCGTSAINIRAPVRRQEDIPFE